MLVSDIGQVGEIVTNGRWSSRFRHTRFVCNRLMRAELGLQKRTVLQMPPRHGKTISVANVLPFHYLTMFPNREVMYVTHSSDLAAEQGELVRNMVVEYGPAFGIGVSDSSHAKDDFSIIDQWGRPTGGSFRTFGIGSGIHGRGCSLLILDDLFKNVEEATSPVARDSRWRTYTSSLHTRLAPGGSVVSIGTPLHSDDWFGRALQAQEDGGDQWDWIKLPAFAEDDDPLGREEGEPLWAEGGWTAEELEAKKQALTVGGNYRDWAAQYELRPVSGDGVSEWPDRYFEGVLKPWEFKPYWTTVLTCDTSKGAKAQKKGDWQAFCLAQADAAGHVRIRTWMSRLDVKGLRARAIELHKSFQPEAFVVETNSAGYALLEDLWEVRIPALGRYHNSHENKVTRLTQRLGRALEAGILHFDDTPDNRLVVNQARVFPFGKYDDGIDAVEMALEFISQMKLPKKERRVTYQTRAA